MSRVPALETAPGAHRGRPAPRRPVPALEAAPAPPLIDPPPPRRTGALEVARTELTAQVRSEDLGGLMQNLDYGGQLRGGSGQAQLQASWSGGPSDFQLGNLQGSLDLHGMTVEKARETLWDFIAEATRFEVRCVRVTHGKAARVDGRSHLGHDALAPGALGVVIAP